MKALLKIEFPKTKDKVRGSIPYGYKLVEDGSRSLELIPEHIEILAKMINGLIDKTVASLREISPGVMVNKNYKPGKDPALDKVIKDLKGDPTKLDSSGMGTHYKI